MSQDVVADALNQIMNAKKTSKRSVKIKKYSKVLLGILAIGKLKGYITDYSIKKDLEAEIGNLNFCRAIKPRYIVKVKDLEKYIRRYLPARDMGCLVISTSKGLMTHQTALEKKIGGSLLAYFY